MNHYIIPKSYLNIENITLNLQLTSDILTPFICHSLFFYLNDTYNQIYKLLSMTTTTNVTTDTDTDVNINDIINPYKHIMISNYTNTNININNSANSKPLASIFFELFELCNTFNIDEFINANKINNIAHLTHNYLSSLQVLNALNIHTNNTTISCAFNYDNLIRLFINNECSYKLDLIICEFKSDDYTNINTYLKNMLLVLSIITRHQGYKGICIIKIDAIFYKVIVEIIFILSSLYAKIHLAKPNIINITEGNKYLICSGFMYQNNCPCPLELKIKTMLDELNTISVNTNNTNNTNIQSILENEIPSFFLNKLEETSVVMGQQQVDIYDQLINVFKHKNSDEKISNLRKNYIQKYCNLYDTTQLMYKQNLCLHV